MSLALFSLLLMLYSSPPLSAQSSQEARSLDWSRGYCEKILKRHTEDINIADTHWGTLLSGGIGKIAESERNFFVWLTEPAAKAYTRLIQLKAYLSDAEAEEVYRELRPPDKDYISVIMFSRSGELGWTNLLGVTVDEGEKPDELGKRDIDLGRTLFLVQKKNKERGSRIEAIEPLPHEIIVPTVSRFDTAFGALLRFGKTTQDATPLVKSLKDEIVVSFYRLGKERKTTFKIKKFGLSSLEDL